MHNRFTGSGLATGLLVAALAVGVLLTCVVVAPTSAETRVGYVITRCADGRQAESVDHQVSAALAVGDYRQGDALAKQAAEIWYECAQRIRDPYGHDLALILYAQDLLGSIDLDDPRQRLRADVITSIVYNAMNELAYATRYNDIRRMALATKQNALVFDNMACRENEQAMTVTDEAAGVQPVPDSCPSVPPLPSP